MTTALADLLFWVVILIALYFLVRYLQKRKAASQKDDDT